MEARKIEINILSSRKIDTSRKVMAKMTTDISRKNLMKREQWRQKLQKVKSVFDEKEQDRQRLEIQITKEHNDKFNRSALANSKLVDKRQANGKQRETR